MNLFPCVQVCINKQKKIILKTITCQVLLRIINLPTVEIKSLNNSCSMFMKYFSVDEGFDIVKKNIVQSILSNTVFAFDFCN